MPRSPSDPSRGGTHRLQVELTPEQVDFVAAHLWLAGALGVWERPARLVAWFADPRPELPTELPREVAASAHWSVEPDRDWQEEWKATIGPVHAGSTTIVPTWLAADHQPRPGERTIVLDPGRAFGSGHHATTTLCLELLDELDLAGARVTDIGCGTGVLAIAAALRGATVVGVDIDPAAIEVTAENAARNGVTIDARVGSVEVVPAGADVVVANLVTDVIVALATDLVAASRAVLVVSGIATSRAAHATMALEAAGATVEDVRERDGWIAVRATVVPDPDVPSDPRPATTPDPAPSEDPPA